MSLATLALLVTICVAAGLASVRVRDTRVALLLAAGSLMVAAVSLAQLAASVLGVASPEPTLALSFVLLTSAGGGLLIGELSHVARAHSGTAAIGLLVAASGVGATVYAFAA